MKFKVKDMDIATGDIQIAIINQVDAQLLDIHAGDRIEIHKNRKKSICIVDIAESTKTVPLGKIGLMEEVLSQINAKDGNLINFKLVEKPYSLVLIKKRLDGKKLNEKEIYTIIKDMVENRLTSVEITYFVASTYIYKFTQKETSWLTKAMINTGDILKFKGTVFDKHCIGGIPGNRTTMLVIPIVSSLGIKIPKTSSRAITSPAGTADTMEVLTNVNLSTTKIKNIVKKYKGCMVWGGSISLAPADEKIIQVENTLNIDAESQLLASILAKKGSVSANHVLIDIPVGKTAKITNLKTAKNLKKRFEKLGKEINMKVTAIITDGCCPIGNGFGPALEARDVLWCLENDERAPQDLIEKSLKMAGIIIEQSGKAKKGKGKILAKKIVEDKTALKQMKKIIVAQGKKITKSKDIKIGEYYYDYKAKKNGKIKEIDNKSISKIAHFAGAPKDKGAGIYLYKKVNDNVKKGDIIFRIYAENKLKLSYSKKISLATKPVII